MKALKILGISVGLILAIYLILALFGSSKCHVERSIMVSAPADKVHNEINTLKQWQHWSYWDNIDPNMKSTYEGPEAGVGAIHHWESTNDSVGKGSLTIKKSEPNVIEMDLAFEGMGTSTSGWGIKDTSGMTMVTAYMDMDIPFLMRPMMMFMDMDAMLGADFEKSLNGLKKHVESLPNEGMTEYQMEMTTVPGYKLLSIKDSCNLTELSAKLGAQYGEIMAEMEKQGLKQAGPVVAVYERADYLPDGGMFFVYSAAIPVDKAGKSTDRISYWESDASGSAVKCNYYGDYNGTGACHEAIDKYITANNKMVNGPVWEVYVTDSGTEPDTAKWLTEIYYPVQ